MRLVCPLCGRQTDRLDDGMCPECRLKSTPIATIHPPEPLRVCKRCGAVFHKRWVDVDDIEQHIRKRVLESIDVHPEARDVRIELWLSEMSSNLYRVRGEVAGTMGTHVSQPFVLDVRLAYESCPSCSRIAGGYFEGVVQVRSYASGSPTDAQLERVLHIMDTLFSGLRRRGDRLARLTREKRVRGGLDLYVGSAGAAKKLCTEVISQMGGTLTTSSTLVGRRDGRAISRITYALRLPSLLIGDVVMYKGEPHVVKALTNRVHLEHLYGKGTHILPLESELKVVGRLKDAKSVPVLEEDATALQVLHPERLTPAWVRRVQGVHVGDEVHVLVVDGELVPVPKKRL
ncbi:MAG: 60S ribosomal export protein NMD3 [Methermicoccaceae archaeon]